MASYRRHEIVTGVFVMTAVATFAAFAFKVGNLDPLGLFRADALSCRAYFNDVKTLDEGAKVAVAGRRVGSVRRLRIADAALSAAEAEALQATLGARGRVEAGMFQARVEVDFDLDDPNLRFDAATAQISLAQDGFLGRHFLLLEPGYWNAGATPLPVRDRPRGEPIVLQVTESPGLDQLIGSLQPVVRRVDGLLESLQRGVFDADGIARARKTLQDIGTLVANAGTLLDAEHKSSVQQLVLQPLRELLTKADAQLLPKAQELLVALQRLLATNGPKLDALLSDLNAASADLDQRIAAVQTALQRVLDESQGILSDNRAELAETTRRLRRTMWQAEMAMRKIRANPAFLLFGDDEVDLNAEPRDATDLTRSGRARGYGQRDEGDGK